MQVTLPELVNLCLHLHRILWRERALRHLLRILWAAKPIKIRESEEGLRVEERGGIKEGKEKRKGVDGAGGSGGIGARASTIQRWRGRREGTILGPPQKEAKKGKKRAVHAAGSKRR